MRQLISTLRGKASWVRIRKAFPGEEDENREALIELGIPVVGRRALICWPEETDTPTFYVLNFMVEKGLYARPGYATRCSSQPVSVLYPLYRDWCPAPVTKREFLEEISKLGFPIVRNFIYFYTLL